MANISIFLLLNIFLFPPLGQALAIFKTREAAERVIKRLNNKCLMVSNERPLVADIVALPESQRSGAPSFAGHIFIDRVRHQMQREMREAVSTSHCSQPNTIEYEMAMEWRLLQSRSDFWWKMLFEQQRRDRRRIATKLKSK
nr:protein ANTI-SILENCING 1 isoform X1 [Ipomoea batatas]GMC93587.1 protein ANTI-SILENCING 1 isoform X1 [Ipomoea batatas]GMC95334.1 protein ANTI-SILENCING 1 isoform X1 [Ipomoea batatas]